jgi:predicted metal-dependent phosphoesterase TrpH
MSTSRVDMHCRTTASASPQDLYALEKRRGMDFVTIADRDSIDGVLEIADRPDVFVSVELTARLRDSLEARRILCWGISAFDHSWLQRRSHDLEVCLAYLREHSIAWAFADALEASTYFEAPHAETPWEFLAHVRRGWATQRAA